MKMDGIEAIWIECLSMAGSHSILEMIKNFLSFGPLRRLPASQALTKLPTFTSKLSLLHSAAYLFQSVFLAASRSKAMDHGYEPSKSVSSTPSLYGLLPSNPPASGLYLSLKAGNEPDYRMPSSATFLPSL